MENLGFLGFLSPIAFVFALGAYSQLSALKKEVEHLKTEVEKVKAKHASDESQAHN